VRDAGGVLSLDDLAQYRTKDRTPLETTYRGKRVFTMPPPSSGGIVIETALDILADKVPDPAKLGAGSSAYLHVVTEALKHGFADRARHLGDPDFVEVPIAQLTSPAYHHQLAARVRDDAVLPADKYGTPGADPTVPQDGGTAHLSVIDGDGNAVALTTTVNLYFGARLVAGDTGIVLNDQMDDFAIKPGVPNAFKLVGTDKNAIAPGKRPLSSMSPTIVLDEAGGVKLAVGGAGGPTIISGTLLVMLGVLDFGLDAQAASAAARIHHQWMPDTLAVEPQIPRDVIANLEKRGHKTKEREHIASVNIVVRTDKGIEAASEFRSGGAPAGE
jgi:gamma-glutamyltranspeptidase/glutathione hydrolase